MLNNWFITKLKKTNIEPIDPEIETNDRIDYNNKEEVKTKNETPKATLPINLNNNKKQKTTISSAQIQEEQKSIIFPSSALKSHLEVVPSKSEDLLQISIKSDSSPPSDLQS